ncbi:rhomboid family intramembrane serine protease [Aliiroseovarius sp. F47248L]|uniref:rhomboid family intramembrane serine protease n=1 Tax=Aliiroseovarius sp. F47248L TaxID=2926420 RepID=UPI001FF3B4BF|nr:rhomboid family intramembrane serine protease [Aliiroseovarius sp. F47248L]MCK0138060.1 rhomboid family intramembrane serine protease [Aliiroseovarius sp. F47248L]
MFPIRDHNPSERTPYVTYGLIAANLIVFLMMLPLYGNDAASGRVFVKYGLIPLRLMSGDGYETILTSMFLHGSFMHFAGNMLFLWIFGDNLEDILGHVRFAVFYLVSGLGAALLQVAADVSSVVPMVGASGAITGVMGGYLLLFPRARVDVLFIFVVIFRVFPFPAWLMLLLWFGLQVVNGALNWSQMGGGVAYWAHAGGFIAGFLFVLPVWKGLGGQMFWAQTDGHPDHPDARYKFAKSTVPTVRRRK